jgi:hypothetical protein
MDRDDCPGAIFTFNKGFVCTIINEICKRFEAGDFSCNNFSKFLL